ncbi:uncharacterized protein P884DRAFT_245704 [Thermothelomyces heterothallicus CBS 202.75]|uniref:uncharacterized protein n=1 Tax=Thermothelomyces heterothallicus CBS 202.75 TaxID=1149848 RepID=UPI003743BF02
MEMEHEIKQATQLLQAQRAVDRDEQPLAWIRNRLSSQAGTVYTPREVNKVLAEVVEADGSVGVVKALLALGADVNFVRKRHSSTWNKLTHRNQPSERNNILIRAVTRCRPETVHAIAAHADQANLDSALHHAIARGNLAVVAALMEHGASPVHLHDDFQEVVFHDQLPLLKVLLSGHHLPCLACRSTGLRIAVENRSVEAVRLLLEHWADVNYGDAVALTRAVELLRPDLVSLLLSGPVQPSSRSLDAAVGKLHPLLGDHETGPNREMLELCLAAGATGPETIRLVTEGLIDLVRRRQTHLIGIILRYKRAPGQFEAAALIEAIRAEHMDVVAKLLEFKPSSTSLAIAISQTVGVGGPQFRYEATHLLIQSGARGPCAGEALAKTVHCLVANMKRGDKASIERDTRLFHLLLHEGKADVDWGKGEALQVAVRSASVGLVEEILAKEPSPESLGTALKWAMDIRDGNKKQVLVEMLVRRRIDEDAAGNALVTIFKTEPGNAPVAELLLTRASVNYNDGEVFIHAIRNFRPETFHLLLGQGIGYKALFTAVTEGLKAPRPDRKLLFGDLVARMQLDHLNIALKHIVLEHDSDLDVARMLLDSGAEPAYEDGLCIKHAASMLNHDLLSLLSAYLAQHSSIYTQALAAIISRGKQWIAFEHVEVINILLQHGASGHIAGKAMIDVVDQLVCQPSRADLADTFLRKMFAANVDVNHENGKAISIAASRGDLFLLRLLLANGATPSSATLALTAAIMAHHDEPLLLQIVGVLSEQETAVPDFNRSIPGLPPPIFQCLKAYGHSVVVLDSLVRAGCRLETTVPMQVFSHHARDRKDRSVSSEMEPVSVLMWALLQEEGLISLPVIAALIRHGADLSYTTPLSRTTPLLVAAKSGRIDIVRLLLESGARISVKDALGHSALFYASRSGNAKLVELLLGSKPPLNDGSLHEACRGFHVRVMQLLLEAGHDANFRSIKHGGRTALGEIALRAAPPADVAIAEEALDLLAAAEASPLLKVDGKTVIFLALDNEHNETITKLLLERMLYRTLNSLENTYQHGTLHYSPTMYIAKGILLGPPSEILLQLLKAHGCEDRYYATIEETQPHDAVGLPEEIRDYERERRARERQRRLVEEEHASAIRREREKAAAVAQLEADKHHHTVQQREELSQQQRRHRGLDHHQAIQMKAEKHHAEAQIKLSAAGVHSSIRWQKHADDLAMQAQKRDADLAHRQASHQQRVERQRDEAALEAGADELRRAREEQRQRLTYENQKMVQEYEMLCRRRQLEREALDARVAGAREKHEMKMTELRSHRGNIIGQVNLEELRRWHEIERRMKLGAAPIAVEGKKLLA